MNSEKMEQHAVAKHDASVLDLAFLMDCTGSMGSYIENATQVKPITLKKTLAYNLFLNFY